MGKIPHIPSATLTVSNPLCCFYELRRTRASSAPKNVPSNRGKEWIWRNCQISWRLILNIAVLPFFCFIRLAVMLMLLSNLSDRSPDMRKILKTRQTDWVTDRKTDRKTGRQTGRLINSWLKTYEDYPPWRSYSFSAVTSFYTIAVVNWCPIYLSSEISCFVRISSYLITSFLILMS